MQKQYSNKRFLLFPFVWTAVVLLSLGLAGCGAQRKTTKSPAVVTEHYRSVAARQLPVTVTADSLTYTVYCAMQAVRDSVVVLSVQPMAGMEIVRIEVSPKAILGVDRTHKRYCIVPLELPRKGGKWHSLPLQDGEACYRAIQEAVFSEQGGTVTTEYDGHRLLLQIGSGNRTYDEPFTVRPLKLNEYEEITAHSLLGL
jgi:hypothetical protein